MRRIVRLLLLLFPPSFRRDFGPDMLQTFDDRWQEDRGWRSALRLVLNLAAAGIGERLSDRPIQCVRPKGDAVMATLLQDVRFAARMLLRTPAFTTVALVTLSLAIGVNTAMFSIAYAALWRTLPFAQPDRLVAVAEVDATNPETVWGASYLNFREWQKRSFSLKYLAGLLRDERVLLEGSEPVRLSGLAVTHDFFDVMGVTPEFGRVFDESDDKQGGAPVIVLSHRTWITRFAADPSIIGRAVRFDDPNARLTVSTGDNAAIPGVTVIGVMPLGFEYQQAEYWVPLEQVLTPYFRSHRNVWVMTTVGRMRDGKTAEEIQKEIEGVSAQIRHDFPETNRGLVAHVTSLQSDLSQDIRPALLVLLGAVAVVLLVACANLAGLMVVRGQARAKEMSIRSALGVGGVRLVRQLLTESALLATAGAFGGTALAAWATRATPLLTKDPRLLGAHIDTSVLLFAVVVTVATTILFGLAPAIRTIRVDASTALSSGSRGGFSRETAWAQRSLVVGEVALCVILLAGAGLLVKSFHRVLEVQPGFHPENLVTLRVGLPSRYNTVHAVLGLYTAINNRLTTLPGASGATLASRLPITGNEARGDINIEGRPAASGELGTSTFRGILPNFFHVMGIPLISGRVFDERDDLAHTPVVIISDSFRRNFWPNESPIGKRIKIGPANAGQWSTIVGVVGDVHQVGLDSEPPYSIYEPLATRPATHFDIALRTQKDPQIVMASAPRELRRVEPELVIEHVTTMARRIDDSVAPRRLTMTLFVLFAGLSLTLAAVGLYGVVAYAAEQRIPEFGVRMALGARPADVLSLVLVQGLGMALLGVVIGLATTAGVGRVLKGLLFGVEPTDPWTLVGVGALLIITALVACWTPARRAIRIDPVDALRGE